MKKQPCVYILSNRYRGTLYVGVTTSIVHRTWQHRTGRIPGFTSRYHLRQLVYYEFLATVTEAIKREKRLKRWRREWKIALIESVNPGWKDLWREIV
jgi:putative endonuclease